MANEIVSANAMQMIPKLVSAQFMPALVGKIIMGQLVNRNYEGTFNGGAGDVVNVPLAPTLVANNIAETGSVQNQNPSPGNAQITLTQHIEASFSIPDITKILVAPDLVAMYWDSAVKAIAEKIETLILGVYGQFNYNASVGTSNTAITEAVVDLAETNMFASKVPEDSEKYLVVSGAAYSGLRQLPRFTELQTAGVGLNSPSPILTGTFLEAKGMKVFRSQFVPKVASTTYNLAFVRDAIALAMRTLPIAPMGMGVIQTATDYYGFGMRFSMAYIPTQLEAQFTVDAFLGVGVLRNGFAIQVLS